MGSDWSTVGGSWVRRDTSVPFEIWSGSISMSDMMDRQPIIDNDLFLFVATR